MPRPDELHSDPLPECLVALMAMLEHCSIAGKVELDRVLTATLYPTPTSAQSRISNLAALAEVLESSLAVHLPHHPVAPVQIGQDTYDRVRSAGAPSSATLTELYGGGANGGWYRACRAAWGLLPDGRKRKPGASWRYPNRARGDAAFEP